MAAAYTGRTLSEIANIGDPQERVPKYATVLEYLLRSISPPSPTDQLQGLRDLLKVHSYRFSDHRNVIRANWVRNDIVHALGASTLSDWVRASAAFEQAIYDVVPHCASDVCACVEGYDDIPVATDGQQHGKMASFAEALKKATVIAIIFAVIVAVGLWLYDQYLRWKEEEA